MDNISKITEKEKLQAAYRLIAEVRGSLSEKGNEECSNCLDHINNAIYEINNKRNRND